MDKYEFNIKVEQIKKLVNKGDFETAMKIADTIDWRRVRSTSLLTMISQIYEKNAEYQDAKDILLLAYERAPLGKGLLYKLTDLALRENNIQEAEAYYREFCELSGDDPRQYLLRFLILEAKDAPLEQQINSLERYCQEELDEKWLYHLAELYHQANQADDCVRICDKIMLMFGLGKYVDKAMELKLQYAPLTKYQMDLVENREASDRFFLLSGDWKFRYFTSVYDVKEEFFAEGYDTSAFETIPVPSVWQNYGHDHHQYTNVRYPFPVDPPYVPYENPCGAYVRTFEWKKQEEAPRAFLNFEGVDSCFYVWMNGSFVGYSQVSHSTSEFDVTDLLNEGENTLAVLVLKWCDGSYLEDQDKFRMSGIFRDVYLLKRPEKTIRDYHITTDVEKDSVVVKLDMHFAEPVETKVTIEDKYGAVVARGEKAENGGNFTFI